jgi:hypothetical protein
MKSFRDIFDWRHKVPLRWGLLLLSTLFISSATALVYDRVVYERPLNVGNAVTTGSGSTTSTGVSFSPPTILVLAVSALVIGLSIFGFLREARKHVRNPSGGGGSLPTGLGSSPLEAEEWEESQRKDEESSASSSG